MSGWTTSARPRPASVLVTAAIAVAAVALVGGAVFAATEFGVLYVGVPVGVALYITLLAVFGSEKVAVLAMMSAFATAPMYKKIAPSVDSVVTGTDVAFVVAIATLVPTLAVRRLNLPLMYAFGVMIVFVTGCLASVISVDVVGSFTSIALFMMTMVGLVVTFALWSPPARVVDLLAWSYVAGHMVSVGAAVVQGPYHQGRYAGFATHPNYFGQAGLMTLALLLYLFWRYRTTWPRLAVLGAAIATCGSIYLSGSRAATVVAAVLVLMIPVVERSAFAGFVWSVSGALALVLLPTVLQLSGEQSSLGRLAGNTHASYASQAREEGLQAGWDRFWSAPLTGSGLIDLFNIHNTYLEVAVGTGIFGLAGYLMVLYVLARPLFGRAPSRRLAYATWAFIGFGATVPGLWDRSVWGPVALSAVAVVAARAASVRKDDRDPTAPAAVVPRFERS